MKGSLKLEYYKHCLETTQILNQMVQLEENES